MAILTNCLSPVLILECRLRPLNATLSSLLSAGASDYTQHRDPVRKQRYLARHAPREDWNNPMSAGALSRWVLWNKETLDNSIVDYIQRFDIALV